MPIILDHQFREKITYSGAAFPITLFCDELASLPNRAGPLHWHPDFELTMAESGTLDFQIGQEHIILEPGDCIFLNGNVMHGIRQAAGDLPDPMPNVVFAGTVVAPETSVIYQKYIHPIAGSEMLPYVVFRHNDRQHDEVICLTKGIFTALREREDCHEMVVQRNLSLIFQFIYCNYDSLPKIQVSRIQLNTQIRMQKMLSYIYAHYAQSITLEDIAGAANISRSEAGRCFNAYMGCAPVDMLIQYRLQTAYRLLNETTLTLQEISGRCGFGSVSYFSRQFRKLYGYAPGQNRSMGK